MPVLEPEVLARCTPTLRAPPRVTPSIEVFGAFPVAFPLSVSVWTGWWLLVWWL